MGKPKIRFKGYTDEWEQRKLRDIAEFSKGSGYSKGDLIRVWNTDYSVRKIIY